MESKEMESKEEVMEYVASQDVRFIRLTFFDVFGRQKNVSILPSHLESAFAKGVAIDASMIEGFGDRARDLFLVPDPTTFVLLPWRSANGNVGFMIADIYTADDKPFAFDTRYLLKLSLERARNQNIWPLMASKFQFYLFNTETGLPIDEGTYLDVSPYDQAENIRRDICLLLEQLGCNPYKSFHQKGHGQNEIDFRFNQPLQAADEASLFKWVTRTVAALSGYRADFSAFPAGVKDSSSMMVQIRFFEDDKELQDAFLAGLLEHIKEIFLFLNPDFQSYQKFEDPRISPELFWSTSRYCPIRIPSRHADIIEIRLGQPQSNPYLIFMLLLEAGLDGIRGHFKLADPKESLGLLPQSRKEAALAAQNSSWLQGLLSKELLECYLNSDA